MSAPPAWRRPWPAPSGSSAQRATEAPDRRGEEDPRCRSGIATIVPKLDDASSRARASVQPFWGVHRPVATAGECQASGGQRGRDINAIEDPLARIVGCFDETRIYTADPLVLTVRC